MAIMEAQMKNNEMHSFSLLLLSESYANVKISSLPCDLALES